MARFTVTIELDEEEVRRRAEHYRTIFNDDVPLSDFLRWAAARLIDEACDIDFDAERNRRFVPGDSVTVSVDVPVDQSTLLHRRLAKALQRE